MLNSHAFVSESVVTEQDGRLIALVYFDTEAIDKLKDEFMTKLEITRDEWNLKKDEWSKRMEEIKKEREQMNKDMQGILNDAQWEKYEKMQKFPHHFRPGKQMRRPMPMHPGMRPDNKQFPTPNNAKPAEFKQKGPQIEQPQSKKNNMFIEKKAE